MKEAVWLSDVRRSFVALATAVRAATSPVLEKAVPWAPEAPPVDPRIRDLLTVVYTGIARVRRGASASLSLTDVIQNVKLAVAESEPHILEAALTLGFTDASAADDHIVLALVLLALHAKGHTSDAVELVEQMDLESEIPLPLLAVATAICQSAGRPRKTLSLLYHTLERAPTAQLYTQAARCHRLLGDFDSAAVCFGEALRLDPESLEALLGHVELLILKEAYAEASVHAAKIRELLRASPDAHNVAGWLLLASGETETAGQAFYQAAALLPDGKDAHLGLADVDAQEGRSSEALRHLQRVMSNSVNNSELLKSVGWRMLALEEYTEACKAFRRALDMGVDDVYAHLGLARSLYGLHEWTDAADAYDNVRASVALDEDDLFRWASASSAAGRADEACTFVSQILEERPNAPGLWDILGRTLLALSRPEEALQAFQKSLALAPRQHGVRFLAGMTCLQLGRLEDARDELRRLEATDGADPTLIADLEESIRAGHDSQRP